jgi:serine/threonine protein kinase
MKIFTSKNEAIVLSENPFASGGEGAIYKIESAPSHFQNVCVKIYHTHIVNKQREERIKYMVANPPSQIRGEGFMLGWPMDYVTDESGKFLGFVMPLGFPDSKELVTLTATTLSKKLSKEWQERYDRSLGKKALLSRLKLICNIAIPVHILHATGKYVLKDFKPQNVLVTADGRITICDMDSIQIAEGGKLLFPGTAATLDYIPPEFYSKETEWKMADIVGESWDTFALGVVFYQLLFGIHPYVVTPKVEQGDGANDISHNISSGLFPFGVNGDMVKIRPKLHDKFLVLPQELQDLFIRTFAEEGKIRPSAEEWGRYIRNVVIDSEIAVESAQTNQTLEKYNQTPLVNGTGLDRTGTGNSQSGSHHIGKIFLWAFLISMTLLAILFLVLFLSANSKNKELQDEIASIDSRTNYLVQSKDEEINQLKNELNTLKTDITSVAPFVIYKIEIGNVDYDGNVETEYGRTIYSSHTMYLKPKVYYKGFSAGNYNLKIKWFTPDGSLSTGTSSPYGYSQVNDYSFVEGENSRTLMGWGNKTMGHWRSGVYRLEIWYRDNCVYVKNFRIYD